MRKIDLKKEYKELYNIEGNGINVIVVPPMNYLVIDGAGNPNTSRKYRQSIVKL